MHAEPEGLFAKRRKSAGAMLLVVVRRTAVFVHPACLERQVDAAGQRGRAGRECLFGRDTRAQVAAGSSELAFRSKQRLCGQTQSGRGTVRRSSAARAQHAMARLLGPGGESQPRYVMSVGW